MEQSRIDFLDSIPSPPIAKFQCLSIVRCFVRQGIDSIVLVSLCRFKDVLTDSSSECSALLFLFDTIRKFYFLFQFSLRHFGDICTENLWVAKENVFIIHALRKIKINENESCG